MYDGGQAQESRAGRSLSSAHSLRFCAHPPDRRTASGERETDLTRERERIEPRRGTSENENEQYARDRRGFYPSSLLLSSLSDSRLGPARPWRVNSLPERKTRYPLPPWGVGMTVNVRGVTFRSENARRRTRAVGTDVSGRAYVSGERLSLAVAGFHRTAD